MYAVTRGEKNQVATIRTYSNTPNLTVYIEVTVNL